MDDAIDGAELRRCDDLRDVGRCVILVMLDRDGIAVYHGLLGLGWRYESSEVEWGAKRLNWR